MYTKHLALTISRLVFLWFDAQQHHNYVNSSTYKVNMSPEDDDDDDFQLIYHLLK